MTEIDTTKSPHEHGQDVAYLEVFLRNFGGPNARGKIEQILAEVTTKVTEEMTPEQLAEFDRGYRHFMTSERGIGYTEALQVRDDTLRQF